MKTPRAISRSLGFFIGLFPPALCVFLLGFPATTNANVTGGLRVFQGTVVEVRDDGDLVFIVDPEDDMRLKEEQGKPWTLTPVGLPENPEILKLLLIGRTIRCQVGRVSDAGKRRVIRCAYNTIFDFEKGEFVETDGLMSFRRELQRLWPSLKLRK